MTDRPLIRRVALYARVSTKDKHQDPQLQLVPLRQYVERRGWQAVEYIDQASAGDLRRRAAWRQLLNDARHRTIDLVLVWKLDRAFRSSVHAHSTLAELDHEGCGFISITEAFDTTSPSGRLIFAVLAATAELERSLITERVRAGMALAASRGAKLGRPRVSESPKFQRRWPEVMALLETGAISRRQAAKQLHVGATTVRRLVSSG